MPHLGKDFPDRRIPLSLRDRRASRFASVRSSAHRPSTICSFDPKQDELTRWLYGKYGERVFSDLTAEVQDIREYLQDQEIKVTDKNFKNLSTPRHGCRAAIFSTSPISLHVKSAPPFSWTTTSSSLLPPKPPSVSTSRLARQTSTRRYAA